MATKGNIGTTELARQIEQTRKGQEAKREARHAKRRQQKPSTDAQAVASPYRAGDGAELHALFSRVRKVLAENHVSRDPAEIVRRSPEMRKAMAVFGYNACLRRVYDACEKSGMAPTEAAKFSNKSCNA